MSWSLVVITRRIEEPTKDGPKPHLGLLPVDSLEQPVFEKQLGPEVTSVSIRLFGWAGWRLGTRYHNPCAVLCTSLGQVVSAYVFITHPIRIHNFFLNVIFIWEFSKRLQKILNATKVFPSKIKSFKIMFWFSVSGLLVWLLLGALTSG